MAREFDELVCEESMLEAFSPGASARAGQVAHNICFVGDSHLAAIKLGWDRVAAEYPDLTCDFFGSARKRGADMADLEFIDGNLVPATALLRAQIESIFGRHSIRVADFECIAIVGLRCDFARAVRRARLSEADAAAAMDKVFRSSAALEIAASLNGSGAKVLMVPAPAPSEAILSQRLSGLSRDQVAAYYEIYRSGLDKAAAEAGARLVLQPAHTMSSPGLSRHELTSGAVRLREGLKNHHRAENLSHMNADYGIALLKQIYGSTFDK